MFLITVRFRAVVMLCWIFRWNQASMNSLLVRFRAVVVVMICCILLFILFSAVCCTVHVGFSNHGSTWCCRDALLNLHKKRCLEQLSLDLISCCLRVGRNLRKKTILAQVPQISCRQGAPLTLTTIAPSPLLQSETERCNHCRLSIHAKYPRAWLARIVELQNMLDLKCVEVILSFGFAYHHH